MQKNKLYLFIPIILLILFFCGITVINAQIESTGTGGTGETGDCPDGQVCLSDPLDNTTPQQLIGKIINAALGIVGSLALAMFIYGGFTWMLAGGNNEQITKGKNILIWATIGLIIIFASYALVRFVFSAIGAPGVT